MSGALSRLSSLARHILPLPKDETFEHRHHIHQLSPTIFLPRAAAIEPDACAVYHVTANKQVLKRSYRETSDRAKNLGYYLRRHGFKRVGILAPNTPAFLECFYGIGAAGAVNVGKLSSISSSA